MAHIQKRTYKSKRSGKTTVVWQARYSAPDGRERSKRFARKVDAENWLDVNGADIGRGTWIDPRAGRVPLRAFANEWLEQRAELRPTTRAKYRFLLDDHILPMLGDTLLSKLSPAQVRSWHAELLARRPATAAGSYRLLAAICHTAVRDEKIGRSPCRVKGASVEHSAERPVATVAEIDAAVKACAGRYRLAILLASWCQLRRGEVLGLQRRDIDELHKTIAVVRTWSLQVDGKTVEGPPKTDAGIRTVAVPPNVVATLKNHLKRFVDAPNDSWLFPGEEGRPVSPRTIDRIWHEARLKAGRPDLRFHDLRHSGLTWAAATGASTAELMRRAGHASPAAALRYQHATEDRDRVLAEALGKLATAKIVPLRRTKDGRSFSSNG
jgi:integrase